MFIHAKKCLLCMFTKNPVCPSLTYLLLLFDLSHYYLRLLAWFPPSGMTRTNLAYWYFPVASSCIILTNCSELTPAPYTVYQSPRPRDLQREWVFVCASLSGWLCVNHSYLWSCLLPLKEKLCSRSIKMISNRPNTAEFKLYMSLYERHPRYG